MATLNFPSTPTVGDTYTENGITYQWDGTKWTATGGEPADSLDDRYVEVAGDVMTGGLVVPELASSGNVDIGSGNITLNADGSFTALAGKLISVVSGGKVNLGSSTLDESRADGSLSSILAVRGNTSAAAGTNDLVITGSGAAASFNEGSIVMGGNLSGNAGTWTPKIQINTNGQIIFGDPAGVSNATTAWRAFSGTTGSETGKFNATQGQYYGVNTTIQPISSERRLKENITPIDSATAWSTVKNTPFYSYNFIGSENTSFGPMADEVPDEMRTATDRSDDVGVIHSYDNSMLQARLYTALQTALTRIEDLEARLDAAGA